MLRKEALHGFLPRLFRLLELAHNELFIDGCSEVRVCHIEILRVQVLFLIENRLGELVDHRQELRIIYPAITDASGIVEFLLEYAGWSLVALR